MRLLLFFFFVSIASLVAGQENHAYQLRTIAFYNLENLFDTKNDTLVYDDDRTPTGKDGWTLKRYHHKINQLAKVISEIGSDKNPNAPDLIGVCEIENRNVLADLVNHPKLVPFGYGIVHEDSPDERGIDVALLYKKEAFIPVNFNSHRLLLFKENGHRDYTRDQLIVEGLLDQENIYFLINHWPSRSGGETRSRPFRLEAAKLNKRIIDSVKRKNSSAKIISMGDFNDDPTNASFKNILKTVGKLKNLDSLGLYNPMEKLFKKGKGSLAYRDKWNLFDQIYVTANLVSSSKTTYSFWKAGIYTPAYLLTPKGKYKGYPFRTYAGGNYMGGYSDHFPVYIHLLRKSDALLGN